ncbi:MAG: diguanylate cyclase [Proteobacteria bacterium]|nr:MAG: diguanylate cyclase [Pseudomonadota bacterium]PIE68021.1 MAG: diguanylate cyclase [Deltaproteobacteria bacterium]
MDLKTQYLGLTLNSPVIAASSGMTGSADKLKKLEENGAGAVVLKSLFEEEIVFELEDILREAKAANVDLDQFDYYDFHLRGKKLNAYIELIKASKASVSIPVIASVNCVFSHEWVAFAEQIQDAGADAIELNMFFLPSDFSRSSEEQERMYFEVVDKLVKTVSIPIALKISHYFSSLGQMIKRLSETGISGLVLFNRYFSPDIDIDNFKIKKSFVLSSPGELALSLRWVGIMANKVQCDIAASTGIHDGDAVIKQLLAGAKAVQVASALYKNGHQVIKEMNDTLTNWMKKHDFSKISDFRGKMSQEQTEDPAAFERMQFMNYFK